MLRLQSAMASLSVRSGWSHTGPAPTCQGLWAGAGVDQGLHAAVAHAQVVQAAAEDELILAACNT